jgi:penicillin-binding protein 1C
VTCSLDGALQRFAAEALARQLELLRGRNVGDGAILVLDNRSGEVLAYVANGGTLSTAACVDGISARRQAGSTLKPFLYQLAIERRVLTAASLLDDSPLDIPTPVGAYRPQNYDRTFRGPVSVRTALASSLNVPAVKTLESVGEDRFAARLRDLGFSSVQDAQDFGASLALGSADVTLLELTNAFRTLANGGVAGEISFLPVKGGGRQRRVASADAAYVVADILADRGARGEAFGLDNPLATPFRASAKTGTSKDMRDNWCVGFTDRYTVGAWVGNFDGKPMWNVSGVSGAAPAWAEVVARLHRGRIPAQGRRPPGVTVRRVSFPDEAEPARDELFLAGTEPEALSAPRFAARPPRIAYPSEGMVVALDPDIPGTLQRLFFESRGGSEGCLWELDGEAMGRADRPLPWSPSPGPHVLTLRDPQGRPAHAVRFSVRGRPPSGRAIPVPDREPEKNGATGSGT